MKIFKLALCSTILVVLSMNNVQAFDCTTYGTLAEEFESSTAVFSGKVVAQEYKKVTGTYYADANITEVSTIKLKVDRWWKGGGDSEVVMYSGGARGAGFRLLESEEFRFTIDKSYLVYARGSEDHLQSDVCTRTKTLSAAEEDIKALGAGFLPKVITNNDSSQQFYYSLF